MRELVDDPILVVGDFNATRWNSAFRELLDADLSDAADDVGHGLRTTWKGTGRVPIEMVLDHILVSDDFGVLDTRVGPGVGSDHRPVIADVALLP
jgi:endonuclease/exonuclease/phosphatase (EEP) superfamily protein YafD